MLHMTRTFYCPRDGTAVECSSPPIADSRDSQSYLGVCPKCQGSLTVTHCWRSNGLEVKYAVRPKDGTQNT